MLKSRRRMLPDLLSFLEEQAAPALVFILQISALICFALIPILAANWLRLPFIGAFVEHTLMVNTVTPTVPGGWELQRLELPFGYQVAALDAAPIGNLRQFQDTLARYQPGQVIDLTLRDPDGELLTHPITLQRFPTPDRLTFLILPYLIGLVYLGSSVWVFSLRRWDAAGRAFALFTASLGLGVASMFDLYTSNLLTPVWTICLAIAGGALFNLALLFPEESNLVIRFPFLRWIGYLPAVALTAYALPKLYDLEHPTAYVSAWRLEFIFASLAVVLVLAWTVLRRFNSASPIVREQTRLILWGAFFSFVPLAVWFPLSIFWPDIRFSPVFLLPLVVFPGVTGYAILRYRMLKIDYILSRVTLYALLSVLAAFGYALLVSGTSMLMGALLPPSHPLVIGMMVFLLAMLFNPLRLYLQKIVDARFFRGQTVFRERLQAFTRSLTQALDLPGIVLLLRQYVQEGLIPTHTHIFIYDPHSDQYLAAADESGLPTTDLRFPANSALVQVLSRRRSSVYLGNSDSLPTLLQKERSRLAILAVQLFIPMPGQKQLVGWLAMGPRRSGEPYTNLDLGYLESVSDQAALAVERAQVLANLERRVHEMDVLTRLAQGINITLSFDDILELIYTQTNLILPSRDLFVVLRNPSTGTLYYAFYLENDERLSDRENKPIKLGASLEEEIIRTQRSLVSDDYERECRSRAIPPGVQGAEGLYAWMGVPLNAGAQTIGAISLGNRDPAALYTTQQLNLLQAIADQAAGAIVKARLLQESERRAHQLATLNEIGRSLTSTLEIRPLLNQILESAVEILNSEAGSLFMVDEATGELIFEVTVGPVAGDLVGRRLAPGTGIVGRAVDTGQPVIANDVQRTQGWSSQSDQQTGFITRNLMVVPMQVKERTIGVIEVINRMDGLPFNQDDQDLLTTFTSQAAVAIDNARLYMQTDAALSARVEELSVMQRIDRELNASLDVKRTLNITLEWAIRQVHADAGLIGLLQTNGDGPTETLDDFVTQGVTLRPQGSLPASSGEDYPSLSSLEIPGVQKVLEGVQPVTWYRDSAGQPGAPAAALPLLLEGAHSQIVVPIRRKTDLIGVLLLESRQAEVYAAEAQAFLSRLSDHAAIAISNAQLYGEVQAANIAKSEFVSLVSHELKTPMTSIRGYSDLLAQGAVGPINEVQANFLATIRSNVSRMATLVSDLADISRIEAGRMHLEFTSVALPEAIQEVIRSVQAQLNEKEHSLHLEIPADLPPVWGDANRLIQVLANLVSNANKYTPLKGSITIQAGRFDNQWDPEGAPQVVRVSVQDTGYGISPQDQLKIFQKFFRADDQNIRNAPGTGLGLSITRHLVEMQGGRIWFESQLAHGTTFFFTVPVAATGSE